MSQGIRCLVTAAVICAGAASAQDAAGCRDLDPNEPRDAYRAFDCVSRLDADLAVAADRIDRLESRLEALAAALAARDNSGGVAPLTERLDALTLRLAHPSVPAVGEHPATRAVVAFASAQGEKACPSGWSPFEPARDRFILGAGAATVGGIGGAGSVTLEIAQMPAHSHLPRTPSMHFAVIDQTEPKETASTSPATRLGEVQFRSDAIGPTGSGQPVEIMPPWIALSFCVKDG